MPNVRFWGLQKAAALWRTEVTVAEKVLLFGAGSDGEAGEGWSHKGTVFGTWAGKMLPAAVGEYQHALRECHR